MARSPRCSGEGGRSCESNAAGETVAGPVRRLASANWGRLVAEPEAREYDNPARLIFDSNSQAALSIWHARWPVARGARRPEGSRPAGVAPSGRYSPTTWVGSPKQRSLRDKSAAVEASCLGETMTALNARLLRVRGGRRLTLGPRSADLQRRSDPRSSSSESQSHGQGEQPARLACTRHFDGRGWQ